ncbi:hypothetical protein CDAR_571601 [Caerostris darwini]|uniref:Secreted protein n=1 Tax=Caerostris darwini TaxID=1538125 RepID=A0AAV4WDW6_9ARAC|nr:hypothetical protein CDAR_571601 [Caerostris darwini]
MLRKTNVKQFLLALCCCVDEWVIDSAGDDLKQWVKGGVSSHEDFSVMGRGKHPTTTLTTVKPVAKAIISLSFTAGGNRTHNFFPLIAITQLLQNRQPTR